MSDYTQLLHLQNIMLKKTILFCVNTILICTTFGRQENKEKYDHLKYSYVRVEVGQDLISIVQDLLELPFEVFISSPNAPKSC